MAADEDKHTDRHETEAQSSTAVDDSLDEYGVWVKSGPEDVSDDETEDSETISDLQEDNVPSSEDVAPIPSDVPSSSEESEETIAPSSSMSDYPESMDLSEEEEALLADLESADSDLEAPDSLDTAGEDANNEASQQDSEFPMSEDSLPDDTEEATYDLELPSDLELSDELDISEEESEAESEDAPSEQGNTPSESDEDVLPELEIPGDNAFTMDLPEDKSSGLEIPPEESLSQDENSSESTTSDQEEEFENDLEISFEEETSDEDSESDIHFEYAENVEDLPDLEIDDDTESTAGAETEPRNYSDAQAESSVGSSGEETAANPPVKEISLEEVTDEDFDDVNAVTGEMAAPLADENEEPESATSDDSSKQAFQLIQNELASIKSELAGLKEELHDLRGSGAAATQPAPSEPIDLPHSESDTDYEAGPEEFVQEPDAPEMQEQEESLQAGDGGFFEEDEDETIALTGDELDNILNTAEFIQEQGQPTDFEDSELDLDLSSLEPEEQQDEYDDTQPSVTEDEVEDNIVELDTSDEDFAFDYPDSGAETSEISEADASAESQSGSDEHTAQDRSSQESEPFGASHEEVDALASMDIDTELADIDELDDASSFTPEEDNLQETNEADSEPEIDDELQAEPNNEPEEFESGQNPSAEARANEPVTTGSDADFGGEEAGTFEAPPAEEQETQDTEAAEELPEGLKEEIRSVLSYMDQLLESLPEEKIREFANSEHFEVYKRLFEELELEP